MTTQNNSYTDREALEARANILRARLANTLDIITDRARDVVNPRVQIQRNLKAIVIGGAAVGVLLVGSIVGAVLSARRRRKHMAEQRIAAVSRWWKHPERVASHKEGPMLLQIGRNILVGATSFLAMQAIKRYGAKALPATTET
jgi:hypothetical protein